MRLGKVEKSEWGNENSTRLPKWSMPCDYSWTWVPTEVKERQSAQQQHRGVWDQGQTISISAAERFGTVGIARRNSMLAVGLGYLYLRQLGVAKAYPDTRCWPYQEQGTHSLHHCTLRGPVLGDQKLDIKTSAIDQPVWMLLNLLDVWWIMD